MNAPNARIADLHRQDPLAASLGVELIEAGDLALELALTVDDRHVGFHGQCHGAVLFALADIAMSYMGNRSPGTAFATKAAIDFIDAVAIGERVVARATEANTRARASIFDIRLMVGERTVGLFRGNTLRLSDG